MDFDAGKVRALHAEIVSGWNSRDAAAMTRSWTDDAVIVGFDGSEMRGRDAPAKQMVGIFRDHEVARYVALVRDVDEIAPQVAVLTAHVGMVPPGKDHVVPERNAVQTLVAVLRGGDWKTAVFHNTPAKWDGRPADVAALTRELQAAYVAQRRR